MSFHCRLGVKSGSSADSEKKKIRKFKMNDVESLIKKKKTTQKNTIASSCHLKSQNLWAYFSPTLPCTPHKIKTVTHTARSPCDADAMDMYLCR